MHRYLNLNSPFFYLPVFFIFFIYIVLRAIYVNPFCDEIGTFFDYIETGNIWEEKPNLSSANNHLLITFIGRFFYSIFGNQMFYFRIVSVVSFIIYYFASLKIVDKCIESKFKIVVFLGLISVAWISDFFSYARGYAFSLGAYFLCVYLLFIWKREQKLTYLFFILILQYLSVFSNLSYINSSLVFVALILTLIILQKDLLQKKLIRVLMLVLYVSALTPLITYSFQLKSVGALWWGTKFGWWKSCILELIDLTLFTKHHLLFVVSVLVGIAMIIYILYALKKYGIRPMIKDEKGIIIFILVGHICLTQLLVSLFHVNYPSDRVAMIYVPLILLFLAFMFDTSKKTQWLLLSFLFFPVSFILQMNLFTSVYMRHTRVSEKSFLEISTRLNKHKSFGMDGLDYRNYVYRFWEDSKVVIANVQQDEQPPVNCELIYISDINTKWKPTKNHRLVYSEITTNARIYELKTPFLKSCVFDTIINSTNRNSEFIELLPEKKTNSISKMTSYQIFIEGDLILNENPMNFNLVYSNSDDQKVNKVYHSINFANYIKPNKPLKFEWTSPIYNETSSGDKFLIYFWNLETVKCHLKNITVKIYSLVEQKR